MLIVKMYQLHKNIILKLIIIISIISCNSSEKFYYVNKGYSNKTEIIYFSADSLKKNLVIYNPHINNIKVYTENDSLVFVSGDYVPYLNRPIKSEIYIFPLPINRYSKYYFTINKIGENLSTKWSVINDEEVEKIKNNNKITIGFVFGFISIGLIFGLCLLLIGGEKNSIFYILFLITSTFWMLNEGGYLFEYLWPNFPSLHNKMRTILSSLSILSFLGLIISHHKENFKKNSKSLRTVTFIYIIIKLFFLFLSFYFEFSKELKLFYLVFSNLFLLSIFLYVIYLLYFKTILEDFNVYERYSWSTYVLLVVSQSIQQFGFDFFGKLQYEISFFYFLFLLQIILTSISTFFKFYYKKKILEKEKSQILINQEIIISNNIIRLQEIERNRIGKLIHDEIGSLLATIKMSITTIKNKFYVNELRTELDNLNFLVSETIESKYRIINELTPPNYEKLSISEIIEERIKILKKHTNIHFITEYNTNISLTIRLKTIIYRLIMELITNSLKHSNATVIYISTNFLNEKISILYRDNGIGFDYKSTIEKGGLQSILYHINTLKGEYEIVRDIDGLKYLISFNFFEK